ncbi:hypothetical protein D6D25_03418 [Aureobasidium pullulans]|nr:hypothetical protein D6D25_03418 [Aureobasidium pullulans]
MCTDGSCQDCPWFTTDSPTDYPACQVYDTKQFRGAFPDAEGGGMEVYFDIQQPDPDCAMIIRSPAGTSMPECGQNVTTAYNAACAFATLSNTFMLQWCCGDGDCGAAGAGAKFIRSMDLKNGDVISVNKRGISGIQLMNNGTVVEPLEVGFPPEHFESDSTTSKDERAGGATIPPTKRAKRNCVFTQEGATYIIPGDTRIIEGPFTGPVEPEISTSQTVSWTTTFSAGVSSDIFSIGAECSTEESVTSSLSITYKVPAGQNGNIVWTPIMRCRDGVTTDCKNNEDNGQGTICWPDLNEEGDARGSWAFQQRF